jgi:hypothetical protein
MGQLSQDEVGYVRPPCFGFNFGSNTNLKDPYPQPYPSFSHVGCASQTYILMDCQGEGGGGGGGGGVVIGRSIIILILVYLCQGWTRRDWRGCCCINRGL